MRASRRRRCSARRSGVWPDDRGAGGARPHRRPVRRSRRRPARSTGPARRTGSAPPRRERTAVGPASEGRNTSSTDPRADPCNRPTRSSVDVTGVPSMVISRSPTRMPARSAADPGATSLATMSAPVGLQRTPSSISVHVARADMFRIPRQRSAPTTASCAAVRAALRPRSRGDVYGTMGKSEFRASGKQGSFPGLGPVYASK